MPRRARAKRDPLIDSLSATTSAGPIKRFSPMNPPLPLPGGATVDPRTMRLNPEYESEDPFADDPRLGVPGGLGPPRAVHHPNYFRATQALRARALAPDPDGRSDTTYSGYPRLRDFMNKQGIWHPDYLRTGVKRYD